MFNCQGDCRRFANHAQGMTDMHRFFAVIVGLCCVLAAASADAKGGKKKGGNRDGKDDVVGTRWHYTLKNGQKVERGTFRVLNLVVFKGPSQVGVVLPNPKQPDQSTLTITRLSDMNGVAVIRKTGRKPPVWRGTLKKTDGTEWDLRIVVKDA
jgi:hypothetical protein